MPNARLAQAADLASLLDLYRAAEVSSSAEPKEKAEQIWLEMLSHESISVFVSAVDAQIVATCMLITAQACCVPGASMGSSKMSSLILNFGGKAMGGPLSMPR